MVVKSNFGLRQTPARTFATMAANDHDISIVPQFISPAPLPARLASYRAKPCRSSKWGATVVTEREDFRDSDGIELVKCLLETHATEHVKDSILGNSHSEQEDEDGWQEVRGGIHLSSGTVARRG